MIGRFVNECLSRLSYDTKKVLVVLGVFLVIAGLIVAIQLSAPGSSCGFVDDTPYKLVYLNEPSSYVSATHKVIWRINGCGNNIEDMYEVTTVSDIVAQCTVIQTQKNGGPFFELVLPEHYQKYCPKKPKELTPVANSGS